MNADIAPDLTALGWRRLAVVRAPETAERWRAALEAAGIEAEVRIADERDAMPGTSVLPGYLPAAHPWAYVLHVPAESRDEAARVLIDEGWDGRHGEVTSGGQGVTPGFALRGAVVALLAAVAIIVVQVVRG